MPKIIADRKESDKPSFEQYQELADPILACSITIVPPTVRSYMSEPYVPQPYAPQPYAPQPYVLQPYAPQLYVL